MKLSNIGELSLLEQIRKTFHKKSKDIVVGIGDDAAVVKTRDKYLLITTDMMVEGIHFDLYFTTPYQIGFKLISVNVSDIYAMGGAPRYFLVNIAVKGNTAVKFIDSLFEGIQDAMKHYNTSLIGGDLSATYKNMSLSATLIGYARKYIKRSGAKAGDRIYVTGNLGDSAGGLELLKRIKRPAPFLKTANSKEKRATSKNAALHAIYRKHLKGLHWSVVEPLIRRHLMPVAKNPKNFVKDATSMIDISDGLLIDLTRLCNESKVGARIYEKSIPVSYELKKAASFLNISPLESALSGGEDYELLFTAPPGKKVKAIYIGDIIKSERLMVDSSGKERHFSAEGYQHFG
jgi:thiamine-monophosphate kinase